jgi:hypothetical protein
MFESLPTEIRLYSPPREGPLPVHTVAQVRAKAHVPASAADGPVLLEAFKIKPVMGDPAQADYDKNVPDFGSPSVSALRVVDGPQLGPPNGTVSFPFRVGDYVRGQRVESTVLCVFQRHCDAYCSDALSCCLVPGVDKIEGAVGGATFRSLHKVLRCLLRESARTRPSHGPGSCPLISTLSTFAQGSTSDCRTGYSHHQIMALTWARRNLRPA